MWWPFFLAFGLLVFALSWRAKDSRGEWVAGVWIIGIILMQLPIVEPFRWLYAAALWTMAALIVGLMINAAKAGLIMALIPVGYWALFFDASGYVDLGWMTFAAFGITELAGVAAVIVGGSEGLRHGWSSYFGRGRRVLGRGRQMAMEARPRGPDRN